MNSRLSEWAAGRFTRGRVIFTGTRRRMTSMTVRGDQMAEEMGGICLRHRYLSDSTVAASPAVIWVVEVDIERVERFDPLTVQFIDVINAAYEQDRERFFPQYRAFKNFILNTAASRFYLGPETEYERRVWVIPHHHCNPSAWVLPEERIDKPRVIGYLGQPEHLHDADEIRAHVERLGYRFLMVNTTDLDGYRQIDVGIAWTRRDEQRDLTRSNIKLSNFAAHGIPAVVCDYASYREVNEVLGEVGRICSTLPAFLDGITAVAASAELRRQFASRAHAAQRAYSRAEIAKIYWKAIEEARAAAT